MTTAEERMSHTSLFMESVTAWSDLCLSTGEVWIETLFSLTSATPKNNSEDFTREFLCKLSNLNLQHWENTANIIDTLPEWMRWPQTVPGGVMTDWFDQMRRNGPATSFALFLDLTDIQSGRHVEAMRRPPGLSSPDGQPDDLTLIKGIGPKLSHMLNGLGIYHFHQIAAWEDPEATWVDDFLAFKGRVTREHWIEQAQKFDSASTLH